MPEPMPERMTDKKLEAIRILVATFAVPERKGILEELIREIDRLQAELTQAKAACATMAERSVRLVKDAWRHGFDAASLEADGQPLIDKLAAATPFMDALQAAHNGYTTDEFPTPASPAAAIAELIDEANGMGITEGRLEAKDELAAANETIGRLEEDSCAAYKAFGVAMRKKDDQLAAAIAEFIKAEAQPPKPA